MGVITNIISTIFTSTGAGDVTGDTERLGRAQTRLGQSSAGAGRQFAAQASGLGGLVAAYAGAAATSFALTAAFTGLANAARSIQTIEGLTTLAASSGIAGKEILTNIQNITKGQLSLVESAQQVNLALSAGFNTEQIEGLSEVALKASRALGRDLGDAYTRVVRGSAKMETELLDELGIYTKIEPATRAYAAAVGKTVSQLTEYERRQAFVNSVVAEGQRKFDSINTTIPTAAEKIEAFGKRIIDLGTQLGAFLAERLAPLADFFTNNLAAAIGAFGILGSLVLGKALSELKNKIGGFQHYVEAQSKKINERILKLTKASAQRLTEAQTSVAGISLAPKGTAGIRDELKNLKDIAAQRALTTQELSKAQTVLQRRIANLNALRASELQQVVAARQARAAAVQGSAAYNTAKATLTTLSNKLKTTNTLLGATTTQLNAVTAAATSSNAAMAKFFSAVVLRAGNAVAAVARLSVAMIGLGGFILSAVSIIGIFGSSIANAMGKGDEFNAYVKGLGTTIKGIFNPQIVKDTKNVFQGIAAGSLSNLEKTSQELRDLDTFKFRQKKVLGVDIQVEKTKEDLVKEVSTLLAEVSLDDGLDITEAASTGTFWGGVVGGAFAGGLAGTAYGAIAGLPGAVVGALGGAIVGGLGGLFAKVGDAAIEVTQESLDSVRTMYSTELSTIASNPLLGAQVATTAEKALAYLEDQYGAAAKLDPVAKAYLDTQKQIVLESVKYKTSVNEIAAIIAATGQSADKIVNMFDPKKVDDFISTIGAKSLGIELVFLNKDAMQNELSQVYGGITENLITASGASISELTPLLQEITSKPLTEYRDTIYSILDSQSNLSDEARDFLQVLSSWQDADLSKIRSSIVYIGQSFSEAITAGEGLNAMLFRTSDLLATLDSGIKSGNLSLEQYSQGVGNIAAGLDLATRRLPGLINEIAGAQAAYDAAQGTGEDTSQYKRILDGLTAQRTAIESTITASQQQLKVLRDQEGVLRTQLDLTKFITDNTTKQLSAFDLELNMFKSGAANPAEELAITIGYLGQIVEQTNVARNSYDAYASSIQNSRLGDAVKQQLLLANTDDLSATVDRLQSIEGVSAQVSGNIITVSDTATGAIAQSFNVLDSKITSAASNSKAAQEAIQANASEALSIAISSMKTMSEEYDTIIQEVVNSVDELVSKERILKLQFEADMSQVYRDIDIIKQEAALEQLNLDVELVKAKQDAGAMSGVDAAKEENRIRQEILKQEEYLILTQFANELMALEDRRSLMAEEHANNLDTIARDAQNTRDKILADMEYINTLTSIYKENITAAQGVNQSLIDGLTSVNNSFIASMAGVLESGATAIGIALSSMGASVGAVSGQVVAAPTLAAVESTFDELKSSYGAKGLDAISAINRKQEELSNAEKARYDRANALIDAEQEKIVANYEARLAAAAKEGDIEAYNAIAREKKAAEAGGDKKLNEIEKKLMQLFDSIKGHIETAIMGLNDLLFYGEGNFGDIMGNLFKSIQQDFFKQTIAQPLSDALTTGLFGMFGVNVGAVTTKGERGLTYEGNSLLVKVVNAGDFGIGGALTGANDPNNPQATGVVGWMSKLFGKDGTVSGFFSNLFGEGGILSNLLSGFGSFLGSIFKAIFGGIFGGGGMFGGGKVTGGIMHMAQGGVAGSSALRRDRIPALLEPGEFVVRKPAARMIGTPALNALNANGRMPNGGAPTINLVNEGSPKDVQQAKPRFDGEKYVIDIILRDLSNNGPIRRSLRGGSS